MGGTSNCLTSSSCKKVNQTWSEITQFQRRGQPDHWSEVPCHSPFPRMVALSGFAVQHTPKGDRQGAALGQRLCQEWHLKTIRSKVEPGGGGSKKHHFCEGNKAPNLLKTEGFDFLFGQDCARSTKFENKCSPDQTARNRNLVVLTWTVLFRQGDFADAYPTQKE